MSDKGLCNFIIFVVTCCAMMCVAVTRVNPTVTQWRTIVQHDGPTKTIIRDHVVIRHANAVRPDGYMSARQCRTLREAIPISDLMYHYGWPADDNADDSYSGSLLYPIREDHASYCAVDMFRGRINHVDLNFSVQ